MFDDRKSGDIPNPILEATTAYLGQDWFTARNRSSSQFPSLDEIIDQDGSTAFILESVLRRWIIMALSGTETLPIYLCGPVGQVVRTFAPIHLITPSGRNEFWEDFNPQLFTLEDFISEFFKMTGEKYELIDNAGLIKPIEDDFLNRMQIFERDGDPPFNNVSEVSHFVGWSVCVKDCDALHKPSELVALAFAPLDIQPFGQSINSSKRLGRPSLHNEIIDNFRVTYPSGMEGRTLTEVSRTLGYDRKTTRRALRVGGFLDQKQVNE